ncbi:MAG: FAD-binding protein, partial [bacterium]|nr:FAD-binding protein [bacterium]
MKVSSEIVHDIVVLGAGLTGLSAAIQAKEMDKRADVAVIS